MAVEQDKIDVIAFISGHRIKGTIYVHHGGRISDFLNVPNKIFIPLTNAQIFTEDETKPIYKVPFMNLNRNYVIAMFPADEAKKVDEMDKRLS